VTGDERVLAGAMAFGFLLPSPGIPESNPPGLEEAIWPVPGSILALALAYAYGVRRGNEDPQL
jgi:hypothetical protein